ncbi:SDR family NAD(P)-dependent oxidoreductase [Aquibaculum arenosum]|uniref:SDR family NAD(P)-dependent oxidoreductase n=1 Tax=Aquibaculum arenosum TaxID=3032591 RepID=A0ABT5YMY8_9PROT|nr:SDR family NAD(P)-dependent oxidoreductase [Fodinicurvata sp. CAU 1616]MDF2096332.1 SDR family NAD(P)-dependent oxidoreductase [Fodinicurvata sp. CAU 1616]
MSGLDGRHALVTGAGRGIGAAIARSLVEAGARVSLVGRAHVPLEALRAELGAACAVQTADVTRDSDIGAAIAGAQAQFGPIDILVNNAGAAASGPFERLERTTWDSMLAVNLTAVYSCCQAVLPSMLARDWGRIVTIASTAGLKGYPYVAAYVAAKHGAIGLTRALALETARSGVTINAVCPGYTDTDLIEEAAARIEAASGRSRDSVRASFAKANPQGRLVKPEEVANTVLWLCRPGSEAITGQSIVVAGGEVT